MKSQNCKNKKKKGEISTGNNFLSVLLNTIDASIKGRGNKTTCSKNRRGATLRISKARFFLNKVGRRFLDVISTFRISQATLSKISDKVQTREFYCSKISDKSKGAGRLLAIAKSLYMSTSILHGKADL